MAFQVNLHILLVPLMTQSHLIPFTDMAKLLAQRGPTVTILMTPLNSLCFQTFISEQTSKSNFSFCLFQVENFVCLKTARIWTLHIPDIELFSIPDIPGQIVVTRGQLPQSFRRNPGESQRVQVNEFKFSELSADGILVNSFKELEPNYLKEYQNIKMKKNIWSIGPVSHMNRDNILDFIKEHDNCSIKWLNERTKLGFVVYACFGSLSHLSSSQLKELAIGLESSNHPFIWVIRKDNYYLTKRFKEWLVEENFEDRVKERGLLVRGWVPQVQILSHPAVRGFLTHYGWNLLGIVP